MPQSVDLLLTNALVLTMDEKLTQYDPGAVAVRGDSIIAVGPEAEIKKEFTAKETIDCGGKVLMPGLVNAHTHVPMTLLRGIADDLRLDVWLQGYLWPVEREFVSPDFVRLGTQIACAELIKTGVTTFNDMYFFEEDVAKATAEAGLRAVCGQSVMKFPSPDAPSYEDSLERARDFIQRWKGHELIVPAVAPHAPYTTTPEILQKTAELAKEFDVPLHTHLAETLFEVENMRNENNMPVIPYVKKQGLFEAKVIAAHCVHVDTGEIHTLKNHGAGVSHNPSSNLKLASGFAPVMKMLEAGLNVGIGTDGAASNNDLDMFEEVRLASFVAKAASNDPTAVPAQTALTMATQSANCQWCGSAMETANESSSPAPARHSTNPLGIDRQAEPDPRRASRDKSASERVNPAAREEARESAAKAAAEEAIPAPAGKLFSLTISALSLIPACARTRSRMTETRSNPLPVTSCPLMINSSNGSDG